MNRFLWQDVFNGLAAVVIRRARGALLGDATHGYVTIFHDYEGGYARLADTEASYWGVTALLDIEKKYNVKASYNIVGRLFDDCPEIVNRIISEGHDLASHSYEHCNDVPVSQRSFRQIDSDIKKMKVKFNEFNIELNGFRSPQSKWSFRLLKAMRMNGLKWSAERDKSDYPYIIHRRGRAAVVRLPIKMDDWDYIEEGISPEAMYDKLIDVVNDIRKKRSYGAIGFHPWVQGAARERVVMFDSFIKNVSSTKDIMIQPFAEVYRRIIDTQ